MRRQSSDSSLQGGEEPRDGPLPQHEGRQGEAPQGGSARAREGRWCSPGACGGFVLGFHFASGGLQAGPPRGRDDFRNPACCVFHCLLQEKEHDCRKVEGSPSCLCSSDLRWLSPVLAASQANWETPVTAPQPRAASVQLSVSPASPSLAQRSSRFSLFLASPNTISPPSIPDPERLVSPGTLTSMVFIITICWASLQALSAFLMLSGVHSTLFMAIMPSMELPWVGEGGNRQ